jgi:hypothetical protein
VREPVGKMGGAERRIASVGTDLGCLQWRSRSKWQDDGRNGGAGGGGGTGSLVPAAHMHSDVGLFVRQGKAAKAGGQYRRCRRKLYSRDAPPDLP